MSNESWCKSSYSATKSNCIELSSRRDAVRDSKNLEVLRLTGDAVADLLAVVKSDQPNR